MHQVERSYGASLYSSFDFLEPWNGPRNAEHHPVCIPELSCPSGKLCGTPLTNYVAVVGPENAQLRKGWVNCTTTRSTEFVQKWPSDLRASLQ